MKNILKKGFLAVVFAMLFAVIAPSVLPNNNGMKYVEAAKVKISASKATIIKGTTKTLKITGTSKTVKWSSDNKPVATVDQNGVVTAKNKGTAVITAKVGGKKYTCKVKVENPKLSDTSVSIKVGKTKTLSVTGTTKSVTWSSSDKSVATVNKNGKITAKKAGTATITAKVGTKKLTCKVKVKKSTLSASKNKITVNQTDKVTLTFTKDGNLTYKIADENICSCEWGKWSGDKIKLTIKGKKKGSTKITVTNSKNSDSCTIKVTVSKVSKIAQPKYVLAGYAINEAYTSVKRPSTLHIQKITYQDSYKNEYGEKVGRLVMKCYTKKSSGEKTTYYVVAIKANSKSHYPDAIQYENYYIDVSLSTKNPGVSGSTLDNATALEAYQSVFNTSRKIAYS